MKRDASPIIRPYRMSDLDAVCSLIHRTIDESYAEAYAAPVRDFFKSFHGPAEVAARAERGLFLVAEQDDDLLATGCLDGDEIFAVFVDPDCQGHGLGRRIMTQLEDRARSLGVPSIRLSVSLPSRAFYQAQGYVLAEEVIREIAPDAILKFWKARKDL